MEATSVTGPAKNLLGFCRWTQSQEALAVGFQFSVTLATYCRYSDDGASSLFVQAARAAQIPIHVISERRRFDRGVLPQLVALAGALKPDIVQTHNVKSHFLWRASGVRNSQKWLAFQHGYTATDLKMKLYNQLDRWSLRDADRVITVCQAFVPRLLSYGVEKSRTRVLHNSVIPPAPMAESVISELRSRLGLSPASKVILNIGRFSMEKGQSDLLAALSRLGKNEPWKAVFVGDGPGQLELKKTARVLGLEDRVVFAGFHKDTAPFYAIADIFALPSHSEGSPNVILEAMAAKVPIAATMAGGTPEIVADKETALLVPIRNPEVMAQALSRLLRDENLRRALSAAAYQRAIDAFSPERYLQTLTGIYYESLGMAPAASNALRPR